MKNYFHNNKAIGLLFGIIAVSLIIIIVFTLKYFYFGNGQTNYGDRLDGINDVKITAAKKSEVIAKINTDKLVKNCKIEVTGKIVYINIEFESKASLIEAESKALAVLDEFTEKEEAFYDFQFTLKQASSADNDGFIISGAKNVKGTNLIWNNNNISTPEDTTESNGE